MGGGCFGPPHRMMFLSLYGYHNTPMNLIRKSVENPSVAVWLLSCEFPYKFIKNINIKESIENPSVAAWLFFYQFPYLFLSENQY